MEAFADYVVAEVTKNVTESLAAHKTSEGGLGLFLVALKSSLNHSMNALARIIISPASSYTSSGYRLDTQTSCKKKGHKKSRRCNGITKKGEQCRRDTNDISGYCWSHIHFRDSLCADVDLVQEGINGEDPQNSSEGEDAQEEALLEQNGQVDDDSSEVMHTPGVLLKRRDDRWLKPSGEIGPNDSSEVMHILKRRDERWLKPFGEIEQKPKPKQELDQNEHNRLSCAKFVSTDADFIGDLRTCETHRKIIVKSYVSPNDTRLIDFSDADDNLDVYHYGLTYNLYVNDRLVKKHVKLKDYIEDIRAFKRS